MNSTDCSGEVPFSNEKKLGNIKRRCTILFCTCSAFLVSKRYIGYNYKALDAQYQRELKVVSWSGLG